MLGNVSVPVSLYHVQPHTDLPPIVVHGFRPAESSVVAASRQFVLSPTGDEASAQFLVTLYEALHAETRVAVAAFGSNLCQISPSIDERQLLLTVLIA